MKLLGGNAEKWRGGEFRERREIYLDRELTKKSVEGGVGVQQLRERDRESERDCS